MLFPVYNVHDCVHDDVMFVCSMGGAIAVHVAAKALIPSLMGLAVIDVVEGTVPFQPGHGQFTASRPQQNTATTTSVITKHCCQMYHMCSPGNSLTSHLSPATTLATSWTSMFVFNTIHSVSSSCVPLANHTTHSVKILTKNVWGAQSFAVSAAKSWKELPNNIRTTATINSSENPSLQR